MKAIAGTQGRNPEAGLEFTTPTLCNIGVQTQRLVPAREVLFWVRCIPSLGLKTHHPTYEAVLKMKRGNIFISCAFAILCCFPRPVWLACEEQILGQ